MTRAARLPGALAAGALLATCGTRAPERPDVVLVLVDTLRADYLGCYGFDGDVSPSLDRLAREGLVFERCFAQAPWTKPSIASLFTSLPPEIHRVTTHEGWFGERPRDGEPTTPEPGQRTEVLPDEAPTLAETFAAAGYETAAFVANPWIRPDQGFAQGFETFREVESKQGSELVAQALAWLHARTSERPLFLYLHFMDVHGPYAAPDADFAAVSASPSLGEARAIEGRERRRIPGYLRQVPWFDGPEAQERRTWRGRYAAGVRAFDRELGVLVDGLERADRLDRTLLAVTADHGEELLERDLWDHGEALFDAELHVPLVVRLPRGTRAGERATGIASLVDVAPTLATLAGVPSSPAWRGHNLLRPAPDAPAFSAATAVKWRPGLVSLRTARHKLVADVEAGTLQAFDLERDPLEESDLAASEPELVRSLRATLEAYLRDLATATPLEPGEVELPSELAERLHALGY